MNATDLWKGKNNDLIFQIEKYIKINYNMRMYFLSQSEKGKRRIRLLINPEPETAFSCILTQSLSKRPPLTVPPFGGPGRWGEGRKRAWWFMRVCAVRGWARSPSLLHPSSELPVGRNTTQRATWFPGTAHTLCLALLTRYFSSVCYPNSTCFSARYGGARGPSLSGEACWAGRAIWR